MASIRTRTDEASAQQFVDLIDRMGVGEHETAGQSDDDPNRQSLLSAALARAVDDELVPRNPAHRIRVARPPLPTPRRERRFRVSARVKSGHRGHDNRGPRIPSPG
jgi:hypothetical protein